MTDPRYCYHKQLADGRCSGCGVPAQAAIDVLQDRIDNMTKVFTALGGTQDHVNKMMGFK